MVLSIGYGTGEYAAIRDKWRAHNVDFHFVASIEEAVRRLRQGDYICVTICTDRFSNDQITMLRSIKPVPIVILSPECVVSRRAEYFQRGAIDFIIHAHQWQKAETSGKDAVQYYLDLPDKGEDPLTIITLDELYVCLEYRSVEVRGQQINLTAKEFDILALLITHPKRVYTFEMVMDIVWGEEYTYFSRKTLINHMSNLRQKLKTQPDVPNYIVNVHGVGYKFDVDSI